MNFFPLRSLGAVEVWSAVPLGVAIYVLLLLDQRRKDSPSAKDTQLGLKTVAATLIVVSTLMFATGLRDLLHTLLTFDAFWDRFKAAFPSVVVGLVGVAGIAMVLLPKTNANEFPKAKRLAAGVIALGSGVTLLPALAALIAVVLDWPSWSEVAGAFATVVDALLIFGASFAILGKLSGMTMPEMKAAPKPAAAAPVAGQPPGAYPPQQAQPGYPQQQAQPGYPQQQPGQQAGYQQPQQPGQGWPPQGQ